MKNKVMHSEVNVVTIKEGNPFRLETGVLFETAAKGVRFGELAVFGDDAVAGGVGILVRVQSVADTTGVAGTQGLSEVTVGGDLTFWNLTNESVDLLKEIHKP